MRTLLVIGIGPGGIRQVTVEAIDAMKQAAVFIALDKGDKKSALLDTRHQICATYLDEGTYRFVEVTDPPRDRQPADYAAEVHRWHDARAELIEQTLRDEIPDEGIAAILVWGDPALYDSTLRLVERIIERGQLALKYRVIAGVTSVSALTAAHGILLNRIGEPILITTGRRLADTPTEIDANQVVMLDADCTFRQTANPDDEICWGAYLGTEHEILLRGRVGEIGAEIEAVRATARAEHGWIMDTYLLRKSDPAFPQQSGSDS